ncbi:hypothetical protein K1T71_004231 [Dendrolimus kikuchii]|uniref:Uncharacterized protein n=1 Tax=Dendrolimus kikuchii TaxID=765133 RepID=A0ACC1D715_9NEOP|nr:hypothetical protein K1T71_004231 [Dendrolimus kikuchii]
MSRDIPILNIPERSVPNAALLCPAATWREAAVPLPGAALPFRVQRQFAAADVPQTMPTLQLKYPFDISTSVSEKYRNDVHAILPQTRATFVVVSIPKDLVPVVLARKRRLSYRLGAVYLKFQGPKGRFVDTPADLLDETAGVQAAADVPMSEVTPPLEQKETMQVGSSRAVEASSDDELLDLSRLGLEEEGDPNGSPFLQ